MYLFLYITVDYGVIIIIQMHFIRERIGTQNDDEVNLECLVNA